MTDPKPTWTIKNHGTAHAYGRMRCRCEVCRAGNAARAKAYRASNAESRREYDQRHRLEKRYGVTVEQYETTLADQGGVCAICGGQPQDKVRPATSYVTTACVGDRRYFDLDAERQPHARDYTAEKPTKPNREADRTGAGRKNTTRQRVADPAGAPLLDWWEVDDDFLVQDAWKISTQPYSGSHYAAFPEELPRRLISLMCPQRVCRDCGKPSERITGEVTYEPSATYRGGSLVADAERIAEGINQWRGPDGAKASLVRNAPTIGWTDCGHDAWRPGLVLDPFAGSGTTLAVAVGMGREAIGIDLDERNVLLAEQRVGMFLEVDGPPPPAPVPVPPNDFL